MKEPKMISYRRGGYIHMVAAAIFIMAAHLGGGAALAAPQYVLTCDTCHTMPPRDSDSGTRDPQTGAFKGNHQTHASSSPTTCAKCHGAAALDYPTGHRTKQIQVATAINSVPGATYSRAFANQTTLPPTGTCGNVNCHFEERTPVWGETPFITPDETTCGTCHDAIPSSYVHGTHVTRYGNTLSACAKCHPNHTGEATPFRHATSAGNSGRKINVTIATYAGSNYKYLPSQSGERIVGGCSNIYCHSPGQNATGGALGAGDYAAANWGDSTSGACGTCHATTTSTTGSHQKHLARDTNCGNCHNNATATSYSADTHVDGLIDVGLGGYSMGGAPGNGYGRCSTASCHASPYGLTSSSPSPVWGDSSAGCSACHSGAGAFTADGSPATGSHAAHMALNGSACNQCHNGAVKGTAGGSTHTNGIVEVANDYTASPVAKHAPDSYTGKCLSASCHASPYGSGNVDSPVWGDRVGCASCHKDDGAFTVNGAPATGGHAKHMALNGALCNQCHTGAASGTSGGATHANGTVEVANGYTVSPVTKHPIGTYSGTCTNASCHTDGNGTAIATPNWGVSAPPNCTVCHGGAATVTPASAAMKTGKHRAHMNNYSTLGLGNNFMCAECHAKTVSLDSNTVIANSANHLNNFKDYSGVKAGGSGNYDTDSGVCTNVYCHSSGQAAPVFRNMTGSKAWRETAKFDCNGCHGNEAGASWSSTFGAPNYPNRYDGTLATANSHEKHTVGAGMTDSRGCAKCHLTTVDRGVADKMRNYSSAHLNKVRDVAFLFPGSYTRETKNCSTYCHSNVQAPGGNGLATVYTSPVWGANGTMTCSSCHTDMSTLTETPEYLQLGSHKRHAVDSAYACSVCHGAGYSASTVAAPHADGTINVSFTGRAATTTYSQPANNLPGDGYGTCSTSACHGRATRNWGVNTTLPTCEKCHGSANTAQTSGVFKDTAGSPASSYVGTHVSHLAGTHNYSNPIACNECHTVPAGVNSFGHMTSLPARLVWGSLSMHPSTAGGVEGAAMVPEYSGGPGRQCSNTYCHAGIRKPSDGTPQGTGPAPAWGDPAYLGGSGCGKCHGNPPAYPHPASINCSACHNHVAQSNIAFVDKSKHINGSVEVTVDDCLGCHSSVNACQEGDPTCINKALIGAHVNHTDADIFLAGKKLSAGDYIDPSWIYGIVYKDGFPKYGCGFCHSMDSGTHKNGLVELDLDPTHSLSGTVKTKNKAGGPWVVSHAIGTSVVCNNVYCHSNGYVSASTNSYQFQQTPDWYATNPWGSVDTCSQCHGNSPNSGAIEGSAAHARHVVANHYKDVFAGYSGKLAPAGAPGSGAVHGDPATSTTLTCNICHYDTVKTSSNDRGSVCMSCHTTSGSAPLKGTMGVDPANTTHVNGDVDVVFISPFNVKSKAQLRDDIAAVQSVYTSWTRVKGFKTYTSYDLARTTPSYVGGTCSTVACHNGTQMEWRTQGPLPCAACHTGLPQ
jgi:predicted CxxxxCH...CXXCH cytochrome family protein